MEPLDSESFCPLLFNGLYINPNGEVYSCCLMDKQYKYGDLRVDNLDTCINNKKLRRIKADSLNGIQNKVCQACWDLERNPNTRDFSGRLSALKYYANWMNHEDQFKLEMVDLRWQKTCNYACIMCDVVHSSKWVSELTQANVADLDFLRFPYTVSNETIEFITGNVANIKEIYLAGGEPLQMTENAKLLNYFLKINPDVIIRLNTNLSTLDTEVYRIIRKFPQANVQWNISIDGELEMYEYVRYPGKWNNVYQNLKILAETYDNIFCDILVNVLNYDSVLQLTSNVLLNDVNIDLDRIKFTALSHPEQLDIRNYSNSTLDKIIKNMQEFIDSHPTNNVMSTSISALINHITNRDFTKNIDNTRAFLLQLDKRRNSDYKTLGTYLNE